MSPALLDPCGRFLPALLLHDLKDRLQGRRERANARWGRIHRPQTPGRLVWVASGRTRASVRLGAELTRALVASRDDIAALFTYEAQYPELLAPLAAAPRTRFDFGPADYIGAVHAMRHRLLPLGIVVAGMTPRPNLRTLCEASAHALLVAPPSAVDARVERIYPAPAAPSAGERCAPVADFDALLHAPVQPAPVAAPARWLWWWHGSDPAAARRLAALFRGHLPQYRLGIAGPAAAVLGRQAEATRPWRESGARLPEAAKPIVAEEPGWTVEAAAYSFGVHFATADPDALWQAAANRWAVSAATTAAIESNAGRGAAAGPRRKCARCRLGAPGRGALALRSRGCGKQPRACLRVAACGSQCRRADRAGATLAMMARTKSDRPAIRHRGERTLEPA